MSFLWKAIGLAGDSIPNFPFTASKVKATKVGAEGDPSGLPEVVHTTATLTWRIQPGVRNEDGMAISIFDLKLCSGDKAQNELARNVLKRAKEMTLLPGLLRCYGATEYQDTIYIATECCEPLSHVLRAQQNRVRYYEDEEKFLEGVAYGLKSTGKALASLHRNNMLHGNISRESVFVNRDSGEWKVFGLEFVSTLADETSLYNRYAASYLPSYRRPPESLTGTGGAPAAASTASLVDSWGLGCLIFETLGPGSSSPEAVKVADLRTCKGLPRELQSSYLHLVATNPKLRHSVERFLEESDFIVNSEYVKCMEQLDELTVKDVSERELLFSHLASVVDSFPLRSCQSVILKKLHTSLQYSACAAVLEPVLRIGARIHDPAQFGQLVGPTVVSLFASQDRLLRYRLLQRASEYAPLLPASLVNDTIWPLFASGFTHSLVNIREYTVRSLVHFAPMLSEKIMVNDVPRHIAFLQQDREGPIRTNATICLCFLAKHFPADQRSKLIVHGFGRMLKDPFLPSRLAALRSIEATLEHMQPRHLAEMVVPALGPLMVDAESEVRGISVSIIGNIIGRLSEFHEAERKREAMASVQQQHDQSTGAADARGGSALPPSASPTLASSWLGSWMGTSSAALTAATGAESIRPLPTKSSPSPTPGSTESESRRSNKPAAGADDGWDDDDDDNHTSRNGISTSSLTRANTSAFGNCDKIHVGQSGKVDDGWDFDDPAEPPTKSIVAPQRMEHSARIEVAHTDPQQAKSSGAMKLKKRGGLGATKLT